MSEVTYAIVFSGGIIDGHQPISVKAHMARMLKADADKMATLFSGKQIVLKRTPDKQQAIKIGTALKKIGADVKIKAVKSKPAAQPAEPTTAPSSSPEPATRAIAAPGTGGGTTLSLAPNEGNIVEPSPAPEAPPIDLSGFSLSENDDEPLAPPREVEAPDIDVSDYSVSDNDGSPLVEPSPPPARTVEAPDFGLDEPGAELETLKEEKELVNPDISNLSLAEPGSDLIEASERKAPPPPKLPDTSNLQLVSVFDA